MYPQIGQSDSVTGRYTVFFNKEYGFEEAVQIICTEESIGIESIAFQDTIRIYPGITNLDDRVSKKFQARFSVVEQFDENSGVVDIHFPVENIDQEYGTVSILFSTLMGDLFGLEVIEDIRLNHIFWPTKYLNKFPGPKFGLDGVHKLLNKQFPLFGVIIKPNLGLSPKEVGELAYKLAISGADFIKDDEICSSPQVCPIFDRLGYVMQAIEKATAVTNKKCLYGLNITSDGYNTHKVAQEAVRRGANCLMLNLFSTGFDILKEIVEDTTINVPIHTHRCMHDIFTSRTNYGVSLSVFAELARMCGADFFHIGTTVGKQTKKLSPIIQAQMALTGSHLPFRKTVPISSRASVLSVGPTFNHLASKDIMYLACGAIYKNIFPIEKAVRAMIEAIDYHVNQADARSDAYFDTRSFLEKLYIKSVEKTK